MSISRLAPASLAASACFKRATSAEVALLFGRSTSATGNLPVESSTVLDVMTHLDPVTPR